MDLVIKESFKSLKLTEVEQRIVAVLNTYYPNAVPIKKADLAREISRTYVSTFNSLKKLINKGYVKKYKLEKPVNGSRVAYRLTLR